LRQFIPLIFELMEFLSSQCQPLLFLLVRYCDAIKWNSVFGHKNCHEHSKEMSCMASDKLKSSEDGLSQGIEFKWGVFSTVLMVDIIKVPQNISHMIRGVLDLTHALSVFLPRHNNALSQTNLSHLCCIFMLFSVDFVRFAFLSWFVATFRDFCPFWADFCAFWEDFFCFQSFFCAFSVWFFNYHRRAWPAHLAVMYPLSRSCKKLNYHNRLDPLLPLSRVM